MTNIKNNIGFTIEFVLELKMRNLLTLVAFLLGGIVFSSTYSLATDFPKCRYNGYSWKNDNDKVIVDIKTDGKCHHSFNTGG